jgi:hypothetical protein
MRKRNAIICGSAFLLVLAGYVAWCYQYAYLRRPFHYTGNIPPEVVRMAEQYRKTDPIFAPEMRWSLEGISYPFFNPQEPFRHPILVEQRSETEITIAMKGACNLTAYFKKEGEGWRGYDFFGKPLNIAPQQRSPL